MSKIEWTDKTWNPIVGCEVISRGCTNCYAMRQAARLLDKPGSHYHCTTVAVNGNQVWSGLVARAPENTFRAPLGRRKPTRYFVNSMGDLFFDEVPDDWIDRVFAVMALCPQHTFQILTKRSARMRKYLNASDRAFHVRNECLRLDSERWDRHRGSWPLPNLWLGVSCEDRRTLHRLDDLRATPAAVRFLSLEPLLEDLGPLDLTGINWVICGGESGPNARPMHPDWTRSLRDQCVNAGVPFFFKQWGAWVPDAPLEHGLRRGLFLRPDGSKPNEDDDMDQMMAGNFDCLAGAQHLTFVGKKRAGRMLDGRTWDEMP